MVTIERERLISEKQNNKASAEGARLPKEPMLLRDILKFSKPSWTRFTLLDSPAGLAKGQEIPYNSIKVTFIKQTNTTHNTYVPFTFERGSFAVLLAAQLWTKLISLCKADHTSSD